MFDPEELALPLGSPLPPTQNRLAEVPKLRLAEVPEFRAPPQV